MRKILVSTLVAMSLGPLCVSAAEVEFKAGDHFESVNLSGSVGLWCPDDRKESDSQIQKRSYKLVNCRANILMPGEFSKVVYNGAAAADEISLSVTQGSGKRVTKKSRLNNGVSTKNINLWVRTLFQRPLLDFGTNQVEYSVTNNDNLVAAGSFDVYVDSLPDRNCRHRTYSAPFPSDCTSTISICDRYFRDENYCQ